MKFFCVTPCKNAEGLIEETLRSVLGQHYLKNEEHSLHYVIVDGSSDDRTIDVINKTVAEFVPRPNLHVDIISEPDQGMYDALAKGLKSDKGSDVYSYLNAGDIYSPKAFEIVGQIFYESNIDFLTGLNCRYNRHGHMTNVTLPFDYSRRLLDRGFYGRELNAIQQESTFWSRDAQLSIDLEQLRTYRYAGDYYLWRCIGRVAKLHVVSAWLGGFRVHDNQLSAQHRDEYAEEMEEIRHPRSVGDYMLSTIHKLIWRSPNGLKVLLSKSLLRYDADADRFQLPKAQQPRILR